MLKLNEKGNVGVDDFVLLENYADENAFIENLRLRHQANRIYVLIWKNLFLIWNLFCSLLNIFIYPFFENKKTYVGPVLVSVNPYKPLDIYNAQYIREYKNTHLFELQPHMYIENKKNMYQNLDLMLTYYCFCSDTPSPIILTETCCERTGMRAFW